ncbi:MAG TPA: PIG-L family deacetylase [Anaerolineales bacterium]|nr:PIG-L family deacetylase [Anaerolineales bacterium]
MTRHLILSPHLDDAVLSLGAAIHHWSQAGEAVLVVTVCAGSPNLPRYSRFARELHTRWGLSGEAAVAQRRREDRHALERLGARARYLKELDAIYRAGPDGRWLYPSGDAIFGPLHHLERGVHDGLARRLRALARRWGADVVYAPLTIGDHVDHVRVRAAAEAADLPLAYYEDFPYAIREARTPDWRGRAVGLTRGPLLRCTPTDLAAKQTSILTYASQIDSLWPSLTAFEQDLKAFHRHGAHLGEWLWAR